MHFASATKRIKVNAAVIIISTARLNVPGVIPLTTVIPLTLPR
jgi:hypothetical protein